MVKTDFKRKKSQAREKKMKTKGKLPFNIKEILCVHKFLASDFNYIISATENI